MRLFAVLAAAAVASSCTRAINEVPAAPRSPIDLAPPVVASAAPSSMDPAPVAPDPLDAALAARASEVAREYVAWGRFDDELRWAPGLCRMPMPGMPSMSASKDASTHGQKLYSIFVKHHDEYPDAEPGQVVVKESWVPEVVADAGPGMPIHDLMTRGVKADHFYPYAKKDGKVYHATRKAGLYIMMKLEKGAPETDEGWAYATVSADGVVTSAGRVASCIGCHVSAPHGRLFGATQPR